jgi:hypothetical protein
MKTSRWFIPLILGLGIASLLLWTAAASSAAADATIRYVATDGADSGGCDTIPGRCLTVQYAVDQADPGDEIRIATGTYDDVNNAGGLEGLEPFAGWRSATPKARPSRCKPPSPACKPFSISGEACHTLTAMLARPASTSSPKAPASGQRRGLTA